MQATSGPQRDITRPAARLGGINRYKTLPAHLLLPEFREKVRPAGHKTPFLGHLSCAGRTSSRSRPLRSEQGELYPACGATSGTKLSPLVASAGDTGRKLSRHTPPTGPTGTKLSHHAPKRCFRPILRQQRELCTASATNNPSRAKEVTHQHPTSPTNAPLSKIRMQFNRMNFQQSSETLQFQRHEFNV